MQDSLTAAQTWSLTCVQVCMYLLVCIRLNHGEGHTIVLVHKRLNQYEIEVVPVKIQEWKLYHHHTYFQNLHITKKLRNPFVAGGCLKCKCNSLKVSPYFNSFQQRELCTCLRGDGEIAREKQGRCGASPWASLGYGQQGWAAIGHQQPKKVESEF